MKRYWMRLGGFVGGVCAILILVQACTTAPVTGRRQLKLVSAGEEKQLGLTSFEQIKTNTPISRDAAANEMVLRVGKRIAAVAELPDAQWEFVVFESKEANAFCLPGGKVGVYTGLLPIAKDDAGLATVLGHEIGHAVAHHGAERMSQAMMTQGLGSLAGSAIGSSKYAEYQNAFMGVYGVGAKVGYELPHSRQQESEADHIGLMYMARAGYDPSAAVAFWERFSAYNQQQSGGAGSSWLSGFMRTHPVDTERIADLKKLLPEAQAEFGKSRVQGR